MDAVVANRVNAAVWQKNRSEEITTSETQVKKQPPGVCNCARQKGKAN
jgi:hypothetical protein